ncbi:MAG: DUF3326 domain-containing protein [Capsulimonadales bacterium]|nr:DUF3326 domain-containing protein [Capsulimonadales bacterium]
MNVYEKEFELPLSTLIDVMGREAAMSRYLGNDETPIRFVVSRTDGDACFGEIGVLSAPNPDRAGLFRTVRRSIENTDAFTAVLLVPTGIGCEIGGHAGDAGSIARLIGATCDRLILHPNVVNGSDINEMPPNALYVEGSVLTKFVQGTVGLQPVRANRVLIVTDAQRDRLSMNAVINAVNAARACYGLDSPELLIADPPVRLRGEYTASGRAAGKVEGIERLLNALEPRAGTFDALTLAGGVELHFEVYTRYLNGDGDQVNPVGGIEAIYTHALSHLLALPTAHAPIFVFDDAPHSSAEIWAVQPGIVDPRMAAEVISVSFLQSVLKGLQRSPRIVPRRTETFAPGLLTASDISCLVVPDGVLGLPILAALDQRIPVVAVRENRNVMRNDLSRLPWRPGQFHRAENYCEAAGILTAIKAGLSIASLRRPIDRAAVTVVGDQRERT